MSDPFVFDHKRLFNEPTMEQHGSHMIIKNVQKPEKTKYLTIDTRYRDQYDTSLLANYNITLPERVNSVKSMKAVSLEMPLTYHNVSSNLGNNSFKFINDNAGESEVIVLGDDFYPTSTIDTQVTSELTSASSTWINGTKIQISRDATTGKITITNNNSVKVEIEFDSIECSGGTTPTGGLSKRESLMSKLGWLLGFRLPTYTIPASGSITGEAIADFSGLPYFYLIIDEFKNSNPHSFLGLSRTSQLSSQQILARITIDTSSYEAGIAGATVTGGTGPQIIAVGHDDNMVSDTRTYGELVDIQKMNVRIVDHFGRIMNFNGLDFSFLLELKHE